MRFRQSVSPIEVSATIVSFADVTFVLLAYFMLQSPGKYLEEDPAAGRGALQAAVLAVDLLESGEVRCQRQQFSFDKFDEFLQQSTAEALVVYPQQGNTMAQMDSLRKLAQGRNMRFGWTLQDQH